MRPPLAPLLAALLLTPFHPVPAGPAESPLAEEFRRDPARSALPDFSFAGYRAGASLPVSAESTKTFDVTRFGAVPNDGKDDIDAIQKAVDAAGAAGGGCVSFPAGVFDFDVGTTRRAVKIRTSNVILRGAGSAETGTIFHDHSYSDSPEPQNKWKANGYPSFVQVGAYDAAAAEGYLPPHDRVASEVGPAPFNALTIRLRSAGGVKPGDTCLLTQTDPDGSLVANLIEPMPPGRLASGYRATGRVRFTQMVRVVKIHGDEALLDAPILWELRSEWKPELRPITVVREVGIEAIRFRTDWKGPFVHHKNAEHDDGWNHIRFDGVENGWVRDTVHEGTTAAVMLASAKHCLVMNATITGPRGHNGFTVIGASTYNLLARLDAGPAFHSFQLQTTPVGNVFLECTSKGGGGIDLHGGLGVHNLYDRPAGFGVQHGGSASAVPPRHGRGLVLWNWQPRVIVDEPNMPGTIVAGGDGSEVTPASLYEFQRTLRLGRPLFSGR